MSFRASSNADDAPKRKRWLAAIALSVLARAALAVPEDAEQPIHISAISAQLDEKRGVAIYEGDVRLDQGSLKVQAETLTIEFKDEKVVRITAQGERASYEQKLQPDQSTVVADAKTIVYHTQEERIELIGDARLTQDENEFRGERIRYDVRAGKVEATAPPDGAVEMTLKPTRRTP